MIYLRRLPRAVAVLALVLLGWTVIGLVLLVNAVYYTLTSASTREVLDRLQAASDRLVGARR